MKFIMAHPWLTFWMFVLGCLTVHDCIVSFMQGRIYVAHAKRAAQTQPSEQHAADPK